jgi:hypothetical protein
METIREVVPAGFISISLIGLCVMIFLPRDAGTFGALQRKTR